MGFYKSQNYEMNRAAAYGPRLVSPKQVNFIVSLVTDRLKQINEGNDNPFQSAQDFARAANLDQMTSQDASTLIGRLKAMPADPDDTIPAVVLNAQRWGRGNRPGACSGCGHIVGQDEGFYWLTSGGTWQVHHKVGDCDEATPAPVKHDVLDEGFYKTTVGQIIQVYMTKNKRLAGKVMTTRGTFEYESGAARLAAYGERMTPEQVANEACIARYGHALGSPELLAMAKAHSVASGTCMFCDRVLDDPRSNPAAGGVGYGPKCAENYGLPWGSK